MAGLLDFCRYSVVTTALLAFLVVEKEEKKKKKSDDYKKTIDGVEVEKKIKNKTW